nr:class I SAM-dependent methyltransferase [Bifidobacterium jacchi]
MITPETLKFARAHRGEDVTELALHAKPPAGVDLAQALDQIAGYAKARTKLPFWAVCDDVIYPPRVPMEQGSSQFTAQYKAAVAHRLVIGEGRGSLTPTQPTSLTDLTGGFGVDFSYMAAEFTHATYIERQAELCAIAEHNMRALGISNARVVNADSTAVLADLPEQTMIYVDPARRDAHGARTYAIADCTPDVLGLRDELLAKARFVMIKLSPMLDWRKTVQDFAGAVAEVHIVSVGNECKELLLVLDRARVAPGRGEIPATSAATTTAATVSTEAVSDAMPQQHPQHPRQRQQREPQPLRIYCVNDDDIVVFEKIGSRGRDGADGNWTWLDPVGGTRTPRSDRNVSQNGTDTNGSSDTATTADSAADSNTANTAAANNTNNDTPIRYLYEPNASLMKAGCFDAIARHFGVSQVGPNSHLFAAAEPLASFPGRAFRVNAITGMGKRELKTALSGIRQANVAVRNFPMTVAQVRKKLRLADGSDVYIFATTLAGARHALLICEKL